MVKYFCDRCRNEIRLASGKIAVSFKGNFSDDEFKDCHFCSCCMDEIKRFIKTPPPQSVDTKDEGAARAELSIKLSQTGGIKVPRIWAAPGKKLP